MKYFLRNALLLFIIATTYSCKRTVRGDGAYVSQTRDISHTSEIELSMPAKVTFIEADSFTCVIVAQQNILDVIKTTADGDELIIKSEKNLNIEKPVQIVISMPEISAISLNGSGEITGVNNLQDKELKLELNGSGLIKLSGRFNDVISNINGSGDILLSGTCDQHKININGSGNLKAFELESDETKIEISGSGDAEINVTGQLKAQINGSGNIRYQGSPHIKSDINGSGSVQKK